MTPNSKFIAKMVDEIMRRQKIDGSAKATINAEGWVTVAMKNQDVLTSTTVHVVEIEQLDPKPGRAWGKFLLKTLRTLATDTDYVATMKGLRNE